MKSSPPSHDSRVPNHRGFTLVELLVVFVIILVLAGVVFSITQNAKRSALKVADMTNLRNLCAAAMAAGNDSAGRFPQIHEKNTSLGYWLTNRDTLEAAGIFKEMCYAPTRDMVGGAPNYDFWYKYGVSTPVHYVYFANDADTPSGAWFLKGSVTPPTREEYKGSIPYDTIIKDKTKAFARTFTDEAWYKVLWVGLYREYNGKRVAAIMQNGKAVGLNTMYIDGHAEWVPSEKIKQRYNGGTTTIFW